LALVGCSLIIVKVPDQNIRVSILGMGRVVAISRCIRSRLIDLILNRCICIDMTNNFACNRHRRFIDVL
jgi:hypothetical protein